MLMINVGCGQTPTQGYRNFDNSLSLYLSKYPFLIWLLRKIRFINKAQYQFIQFCRRNSIEYANAAKRLPLPDESVGVLYSSHMIEHLDKTEVMQFLDEARRVLGKRGVIRLAVPDLRLQAEEYLKNNDADKFIADTGLSVPNPRTMIARLRTLVVGNRHHLWGYDGNSLVRLLASHGFIDPKILRAGQTSILNPGELNLHERSPGSVYVEATKP